MCLNERSLIRKSERQRGASIAAIGVRDALRCILRHRFIMPQLRMYDGISVKEKINLNLFPFPFIGERK